MSNQSTPAPADTVDTEQHKNAFGQAYWMLNSIEMFERLAYFGIRAVVPLYIMQATEPGGLHLSALTKGWIYAWWAVFQSFLPIVTGGFADRYGYKRVLFFAIMANVAGYVMMANLHSYYGFFAGILVLATGTAFFKPSLQGSIAQNLTKANSSVGWGIFYWVVNVGAFGAPFISTAILGKPHDLQGWQNLFYACAAFTAVNLLLLLTFKDVPSGASKTESPWQVLKHTIVNICEARLITWLLIMSCFWLMMYQLWDLHPNFITDWVDSSEVAKYAPEIWQEHGDRGLMQVPQQILLNLNAGLIILLMVPLSWASRKMRTLSAMLVGMSVATCGVLVAGLTNNAWFLLLGIVFFSLGEMWTGPKKNEYLGLIAPPGKKGLYLGYVNIPVGIGLFFGSLLGGWLYDHWGEKATLALKELGANPPLLARAAQSADWSDALDKIPSLISIERGEAFEYAQADLARRDLAHNPAQAARTLRRFFRYDRGQITNLGYLYLAAQPEYRDAVKAGLAAELRRRAENLDFRVVEFQQVHGADRAAQEISDLLEEANQLRALAAEIESGRVPLDGYALSDYGHQIPKWIGKRRLEVFEIVCEHVNSNRLDNQRKDDTRIVAMLWARFGNEPVVLGNLALEYLAQGTSLLHDAVTRMTFDNPLKDIEQRLGIGRTKSFMALSAARGADDQTLAQAMSEIDVPGGGATERVYAYLVGPECEHRRFIAVAEKDWTKDVALLREMIESDQQAKAVVEAQIDERSWWETLTGFVTSLFGSKQNEQSIYQRLATKQDLLQDALEAKDWTRTPEQAAQLLQLNPFEARAVAAAEVEDAPQLVTKYLWEEYDPQYKVWIPFAAIGVIATIALGIFGQMAKRWKDMNA